MDNIYLDTSKLISGIAKCTAILKDTYGPAGGNVVLEETLMPYHSVRNDGKAIMDKIKLVDPIENLGAGILREACDKMEKDSGDGRKTTVLLTEAILQEATKIKDSPLTIKKSLDACLPTILKSLDEQKKDITVNEVGTVAAIAAESEELGKLIQEIYQKIGAEGIIELDTSNLPTTFYELSEGVRLRKAGCLPYSYTEAGKAVYLKPHILVSREKITSVEQLEPIVNILQAEGINELVIYCEDIDMSVASRLALTHLQGGFKTVVIKAPILWKDWLYEDLAKITGATPVSVADGKTFKTLTLDDLGQCDKLVSTKDETRIIGIKDISKHLKNLEQLALTDDQQKLRISWLNTKVAILKVGAGSESELSYVLKKAKDAISASYWALRDGVVKGGGSALSVINTPDTIGGNILLRSLSVPFTQILKTNGPVDDKIVDPTLVVKNAITTAISIAGTILTAKGVIILPVENGSVKPNIPVL